MSTRSLLVKLVAKRGAATMAALLCGLWTATPASAQSSSRSAAELMDAVMWNREPIGGAFSLKDQTGKIRTDADFHGQLMLVYFGFTYCPDICPTDLQQIGIAMEQLGDPNATPSIISRSMCRCFTRACSV